MLGHPQMFSSWRKSIEKLAACRNVRVKLGGLGMRINGYDFHEKHLPPTSDELVKAWFHTLIHVFKPLDRTVVCLKVIFPLIKDLIAIPSIGMHVKFTNDFNIEDREYLFSKTAAGFIV